MKIRCPACGFENEERTIFCSNCNISLVEPKISDVIENPYTKINKEKKMRGLFINMLIGIYFFGLVVYLVVYHVGLIFFCIYVFALVAYVWTELEKEKRWKL